MASWVVIFVLFSLFLLIGALLFVYYRKDPTYLPKANADVFGSYILNVMPVGIRDLVLAGVFATAMGSLSAALNSLADDGRTSSLEPVVFERLDAQMVALVSAVFCLVCGDGESGD